ncbi:CHAT domain-containing protein, partial [Nocardioides sp.]|uniref:CHAT domain-containing protein n=1 Tax=Nocardioides sp. TaxID=35761 RepID=UPI003527F02F
AVLLAAGPGLSGALREVEELAGVHRAAVCLRPPESSVAAVVDALGETSTVHFACHARMRADNPVFSGLRLSDGDLTVQELEMRGVAPHRAVLAACEAGADVAVAGGGMIGFVSALIARGTAGVLASQHLAPDHATASLMSVVHRRLADGASLAQALHDARRTLDLADPVDLVNACGFTVFGAA